MKSYKQFKQELNEKVMASLSSGPSVSDADFSSIRGLGINSGDVITANLPGDKGDRATGKGKDKVRNDVIASIEAGKKNGFIEEDENGKLSYRGTDGKLHNSPYAALEASTSFVKNVFSEAGVDSSTSEKGAESISTMLKSGMVIYNHKKGKVYFYDEEIGSFDGESEESLKDISASLPIKIVSGLFRKMTKKIQRKTKKNIIRNKKNSVKIFGDFATSLSALSRDIDGLSDTDRNKLLPLLINYIGELLPGSYMGIPGNMQYQSGDNPDPDGWIPGPGGWWTPIDDGDGDLNNPGEEDDPPVAPPAPPKPPTRTRPNPWIISLMPIPFDNKPTSGDSGVSDEITPDTTKKIQKFLGDIPELLRDMWKKLPKLRKLPARGGFGGNPAALGGVFMPGRFQQWRMPI